MCFSPVKNATSDGIALQSNGTHPGVAATGEADQSGAFRQILRSIGCHVAEGDNVQFRGINVISGPDIVLHPSFAVCSTECRQKITDPTAVKISGTSSLVVKGEGLTIESLDLDGALVIECEPGATGIIRNLVVRNEGWVKVPVSEDAEVDEVIRMRGYFMNKIETRRIVFKKDGTVEGEYSSEGDKPEEVEGTTTFREVIDAGEEGIGSREVILREEIVDLNAPASTEVKEKDTFCGGACNIL
jgi:UDP-sugar pyrophosphorylase